MNTPQPPATLAAALAWHAAGASVVRVATDGTKRPYGAWAQYQKQRAAEKQVAAWYRDGYPGLGLVTGAISGGLEMFEFEGRAVDEGLVKEFTEIAHASGLGELWQRITAGYLERTPSGGLHVLYRVTGAPVPGNTKLARRPARDDELIDDERKILADKPGKVFVRELVETRGEGGFVVIAPSHGPVHDTGRPYDLLAGGPDSVAVITADEHQALHTLARMLDTMPGPAQAAAPAGTTDPAQEAFFRSGTADDGALKPGDDYEARTDWADILRPHGWTLLGARGRTRYWRRPGKDGPGISATTGHADDRDRLFVFSSSTEFDTERPYTKFGAYAVLEHGGNHSSAARELRRRGYGAAPERHLKPVPAQPAAPTPAAAPPVQGTAALQVHEHPQAAAADSDWPESFTDDGNALLFVDHFAADLRYVPERGQWLVWDAHRWAWDSSGLAIELARDLIRGLDPNVFADNEDMLKAARKHKNSSLSRDKINALVHLARSDRRVATPAARLDAEPLHLNTPGGIVDLAAGTVAPSDPAALHTRSTSTGPDFGAAAPRWRQFLADTFGSNADMIGFVQRLAGYSASGDTGIHVLPFLHGAGQNGKSVLMDVLRHLLGDYAAPAPAGFLMVGKQEHSEELARLQGLRLVVASEVNADAKWDEAKMKELTGGDTITARYMRQSFFTFEPTHHLWLMGNHQPRVKGGGDGFWRRLRMVPFAHKVPDDKKIENLAKILIEEEGPAILAWMIRGAVDVFSGGLRAPAAVMAATQMYAEEEDQIGRFLEECCLLGGGEQVKLETKRLRSAYESWCHSEGEMPLPASPFGRELKQRGLVRKPSNGRHFYLGVSLIARGDDTAEDDAWGDR